jgi:hypothetical protein
VLPQVLQEKPCLSGQLPADPWLAPPACLPASACRCCLAPSPESPSSRPCTLKITSLPCECRRPAPLRLPLIGLPARNCCCCCTQMLAASIIPLLSAPLPLLTDCTASRCHFPLPRHPAGHPGLPCTLLRQQQSSASSSGKAVCCAPACLSACCSHLPAWFCPAGTSQLHAPTPPPVGPPCCCCCCSFNFDASAAALDLGNLVTLPRKMMPL